DFHADRVLSFSAAQNSRARSRLDVYSGETLRSLGRAAPRANALDFGAAPFIAERRRARAKAAVDLRCQHSFDGTEAERRRLRAQDDHGKNAGALGTGHRHGESGERPAASRLLAESRTALARSSSRRQNKKFFHAGRP